MPIATSVIPRAVTPTRVPIRAGGYCSIVVCMRKEGPYHAKVGETLRYDHDIETIAGELAHAFLATVNLDEINILSDSSAIIHVGVVDSWLNVNINLTINAANKKATLKIIFEPPDAEIAGHEKWDDKNEDFFKAILTRALPINYTVRKFISPKTNLETRHIRQASMTIFLSLNALLKALGIK